MMDTKTELILNRRRQRIRVAAFAALVFAAVMFSPEVPAQLCEHLFRPETPVCEHCLARARKLHCESFVCDLHADPVLWNRDLNKRRGWGNKGHVDFPKLREGGVNLQVMGIPTLGPYCRASASLLGLTQGYPLRAQLGVVNRAHWMIDKMERDIARSNGTVALIHDPTELERNIQCGRLSVMFAIEGGQILEGDARNLDCFFNRGVRMIGMAHFQPNDLGGATYRQSDSQRGLTEIGRQVVCRANDLGMIVDMSHSSEQAIREILSLSRAPLIFSHTGVDGVTPLDRNISDEAICGVARSGGVIGIIFHRGYVGGPSVDDVVNHIMYVVNLAGPEHVAYGSDFAGVIRPPEGVRDVSDLPVITAALMKHGLSEGDLKLILGENFRRVYHQIWAARRQ